MVYLYSVDIVGRLSKVENLKSKRDYENFTYKQKSFQMVAHIVSTNCSIKWDQKEQLHINIQGRLVNIKST